MNDLCQRLAVEGPFILPNILSLLEREHWLLMLADTSAAWSNLPEFRFGRGPQLRDLPVDAHIIDMLKPLHLTAKKAYAIRYVAGIALIKHQDSIKRGPRMVFLLTKPQAGGVLVIEDKPYEVEAGDVIFHDGCGFHEVTRVAGGERSSLVCEVTTSK